MAESLYKYVKEQTTSYKGDTTEISWIMKSILKILDLIKIILWLTTGTAAALDLDINSSEIKAGLVDLKNSLQYPTNIRLICSGSAFHSPSEFWIAQILLLCYRFI